MAATTHSDPLSTPASPVSARSSSRPAGSLRFDLAVALLSCWFLFGLFLDGWAHNHGRVDDTFFTPWHLVLYSGYGAVGLVIVAAQVRNVFKGHHWLRALPTGYLPALVGVLIFAGAGVADMFWHETFGVEENMEALMSPSHLALAMGAFLFLTGPIRAAWSRRGDRPGWKNFLPAFIALVGVLSFLTFFTQFSNIAANAAGLYGLRPREFRWFDLEGVTSAVFSVVLMMGVLSLAMRRWRLPFGTATLLFGFNMLLMTWLDVRQTQDYLIVLAGLFSGLIADLMIARWQPFSEHKLNFRIFSFVTPFILILSYMVIVQQIGYELSGRGLWWQVHMWLGVPFFSGAAGVLLSYLVIPPAIEIEEDAV